MFHVSIVPTLVIQAAHLYTLHSNGPDRYHNHHAMPSILYTKLICDTHRLRHSIVVVVLVVFLIAFLPLGFSFLRLCSLLLPKRILPPTIHFLRVEIWEDDVKDVAVPIDSMTFDSFLDFLCAKSVSWTEVRESGIKEQHSPQEVLPSHPRCPWETESCGIQLVVQPQSSLSVLQF
jgi:hypothetical protein